VHLLEQSGTRTRPDLFVRYATAFANVLTWEEVRHGIADRGWLAGAVAPEVARWMDDGMLSRWLLGGLPPLSQSVADARRVLVPPAVERLDAAIAELLPNAADRPDTIGTTDDGPRSA